MKPDKITAKLAVQVCGNEKSLADAEVQNITAKVRQTSGCAVADHRLLFCVIYGYRIECEFVVPSTGKYEEKINFYKIWGYGNGVLFKQARQNSNF